MPSTMTQRNVCRRAALILTAAAALLALGSMPSRAAETRTVGIAVKNHRFVPAAPKAPANTAFVLRIKNNDSTPMEFESVSLRVEKVVVGGGEGIIRMRALAPGRYKFFDDFHPDAKGELVVE